MKRYIRGIAFVIIFTLMICYIPQTNVKAERDFFEDIGEWPIKTTPYSYIEDKNKSNGYIEPSNNQFKSAAKKKYSSEWNIISADITAPYETHIYHFEAPKSGYYTAFTQGNLDTVGAIYEHQNVLMFTKNYDKVAYDDDNTIHIGNRKNCSMTIKMDKGEDYYIVIRAWSGNTGNYKLFIGENLDFTDEVEKGGTWTHVDHYSDQLMNAKGIIYYMDKSIFLTKDYTLAEYLCLVPGFTVEVDGVVYNTNRIKDVYTKNGSGAARPLCEAMIGAALNEVTATSWPGWLITGASALLDLIVNRVDRSSTNLEVLQKMCGIEGTCYISGGKASANVTCQYGLRLNYYWDQPGMSAQKRYVMEISSWQTEKFMQGAPRLLGKWSPNE